MLRRARNRRGLSLEEAAGRMHMDKKALMRREHGIMQVHPDEIHMAAVVYEQPWLMSWYCSEVCAIGKEKGCHFEPVDAALAMLRFLQGFENIANAKSALMSILYDGRISEEERPQFENICVQLSSFRQVIFDLELQKERTACAGTQTATRY